MRRKRLSILYLSLIEFKSRSISELLDQDTLVPGMAGVEEKRRGLPLGLAHRHRNHRLELGMVCGNVDRPLVAFQNIEPDRRLFGNERAAPPSWPERADRRQRQKRRIERQDPR
jgi:hypothetical protein